MKTHDDTLEHFLASLQFKLGHVAGCARQISDALAKHDPDCCPDTSELKKLAASIQDSALHISAALKGLTR